MWMWILIGLNIITKANGYSNGIVPTACETMKPMHHTRDGVLYPPQTTEPPFRVHYERGEKGEPITVSLQSTGNTKFMGFMLEAREQDNGSPVGKFIALDGNVQLLTCNGSAASAVTHKNNQYKTFIQVKWSAEREDLHTITFRATFVQDYATFWEGVNITLSTPSTTTSKTMTSTKPSTTTSTTMTSTKPSTTSTTMTSTKPNNNATTPMRPGDNGLNVPVGSSLAVVRNSLNIFHIFTVTVFPQCLNKVKWLKILCCVLFTLIEIPVLVLFVLGKSIHHVTLITLVCVMIVMNLIQLVIVCLPLKKSHELYEILDITSKVCSVISGIVTSAVIFICVLEIKDCRLDQTECWPVKVMIAYTVWTFLFIICVFILNILIKKEASNNCKRDKQRKEKRHRTATLIVSLFLIVGTVSFAASVIVGIQ